MSQLVKNCEVQKYLSVQVTTCEVLKSVYWHEDFKRNETVWGVQIHFSDGQTVTVPDLCTQRSDVETFVQRLNGAVLSADALPDIVDDYLGELYGLRIT